MNQFDSSAAPRATFFRVNLMLFASLVGALACVDDSVIGEAIDSTKAQPQGHTESPVTPSVAVTPTATAQLQPDCTQPDAELRAPYDAWQAKPNSFGTLVGSEWTGHMDGGPTVTLSIGTDQRGTLRVGDAAPPPQRDKGYLCATPIPIPTLPDGLCVPHDELYAGGVYPTHGASFDMNRLQFQVSRFDPFDAWCQLQIVEQTDVCSFSAVKNAIVSWGASGCILDGAFVDCAWLGMAPSICQCTSDVCLPAVVPTTFDATYDPATDSFDGSLNDSRVRFSRLATN